jgi:hypothetical protein
MRLQCLIGGVLEAPSVAAACVTVSEVPAAKAASVARAEVVPLPFVSPTEEQIRGLTGIIAESDFHPDELLNDTISVLRRIATHKNTDNGLKKNVVETLERASLIRAISPEVCSNIVGVLSDVAMGRDVHMKIRTDTADMLRRISSEGGSGSPQPAIRVFADTAFKMAVDGFRETWSYGEKNKEVTMAILRDFFTRNSLSPSPE